MKKRSNIIMWNSTLMERSPLRRVSYYRQIFNMHLIDVSGVKSPSSSDRRGSQPDLISKISGTFYASLSTPTFPTFYEGAEEEETDNDPKDDTKHHANGTCDHKYGTCDPNAFPFYMKWNYGGLIPRKQKFCC